MEYCEIHSFREWNEKKKREIYDTTKTPLNKMIDGNREKSTCNRTHEATVKTKTPFTCLDFLALLLVSLLYSLCVLCIQFYKMFINFVKCFFLFCFYFLSYRSRACYLMFWWVSFFFSTLIAAVVVVVFCECRFDWVKCKMWKPDEIIFFLRSSYKYRCYKWDFKCNVMYTTRTRNLKIIEKKKNTHKHDQQNSHGMEKNENENVIKTKFKRNEEKKKQQNSTAEKEKWVIWELLPYCTCDVFISSTFFFPIIFAFLCGLSCRFYWEAIEVSYSQFFVFILKLMTCIYLAKIRRWKKQNHHSKRTRFFYLYSLKIL